MAALRPERAWHKVDAMTTLAACPKHPTVQLVSYCPSCRGAAGGRATSPKKARTSRKNGKKPKRPRVPNW
jgi:hypothetical protein